VLKEDLEMGSWSDCGKFVSPEDHCHSVLHFRDEKLNFLLSLAVPGFFIDAAVPYESESTVLLLYRNSSRANFSSRIPVVTKGCPVESNPRKQHAKKFKKVERVCRVQRLGPFSFDLSQFECLSDSESTETSDDNGDNSEKNMSGSTSSEDLLKQHFERYRIGPSSKRKRRVPDERKLRSQISCSLTAQSRVEKRLQCRLYLCAFDLEEKKILWQEPLASGQFYLTHEFPENGKKNFESFVELRETCSFQGTILSTTTDLLIVHLYHLYQQPTRGEQPSLTLHLADLRGGCRTVKPSYRTLFMHPTKNAAIEVSSGFWKKKFPMIISASTDLLVDEDCRLNLDLNSFGLDKTKLASVTYQVVDEDGNAVECPELRSRPAYNKTFY
jgi:hypothetical protein